LYKFPPGISKHSGNSYGIVEYTTQAYLQNDLNAFFSQYSPRIKNGTAPIFDSIDGGVAQTTDQGFEYNGESDLDLQYAMTLVYPQTVTLYQVGDIYESGSFNNFLDAIDGTYCTFEGGDDSSQDSTYPDPTAGGYKGPQNVRVPAFIYIFMIN
jgi:tripeptidyl-peptidase I